MLSLTAALLLAAAEPSWDVPLDDAALDDAPHPRGHVSAASDLARRGRTSATALPTADDALLEPRDAPLGGDTLPATGDPLPPDVLPAPRDPLLRDALPAPRDTPPGAADALPAPRDTPPRAGDALTPSRDTLPGAGDAPTPPRGFFVGEQWRYPARSVLGGLLLRTLADLVAIPSGVAGWSWADGLALGAVTGATVTMALPLGPSLDVRAQRFIDARLWPNAARIWTRAGDTFIWVGVWSGYAALAAYGWVADDAPYLETAVLAAEAWFVTQVYVNFIKLWTGREGPLDAAGEGRFHGPSGFVKYFPSGIPSGHVASVWALFAVVMEYWRHPLLYVGLGALGTVLSVATVTDGYHFVSEVLLGAALGLAVGRWVVRHRSSRYRYGPGGVVERLALAPAVVPGSSYGLSVSFAF